MSWLNKLFGNEKEETTAAGNGAMSPPATPGTKPFSGLDDIRFGRYSDNNKSWKQTQSWFRADDAFKTKNYSEAFAAFFEYLGDEKEHNVSFTPDGNRFTFDIIQGSKRLHGASDGTHIIVKVPLAVMTVPGTAVMRRLLEMNYALYYSRAAMDENNMLYMIFDSDVVSASPVRMYYGLRELAIKSDRQDDLLLADFAQLKPADVDHIEQLSQLELAVKYKYFRKWVTDILAEVEALNHDTFSGSIAYLLLTLVYRIDFLITPEARLMAELEKIIGYYWINKDEKPLVERNQLMKDGVRKLLDITREDFAANVYRSKGTFAIMPPPVGDKVKDNMLNANRDSQWYVDNKYPQLALLINEYGPMYSQFVCSLPRVQTDLITIYMAVMHADFMRDLGMKELMYDPETATFNRDKITGAVDDAINRHREKYVNLTWEHSKINYGSLYEFATSFTEQIANLYLEAKKHNATL